MSDCISKVASATFCFKHELKTKLYMRGLGPDVMSVGWPSEIYLLEFFYSGIQLYLLLSSYVCFINFLFLDLYVLGDDTSIS